MAKNYQRTGYYMVKTIERIKKVTNVGEISDKDRILTVKEKIIDLIGSKT